MSSLPLLLAALVGLAHGQETAEDIEAPDIDVQLFRQSLDAEATLWTNDAGMRPNRYFTVRAGFSYMRDPFLFQFADETSTAILRDALQADVAGTIHFWRMRLGVDLPVYLYTTSDVVNGTAGVGDLLVDLKATLLDHHRTGRGGFVLGLAARSTLPTSTMSVPLGGRGVGYEVELILDGVAGPVLLALNVGHRGSGGAVDFGDVSWRDRLYVRFGTGIMVRDNGGVSLDVTTSSPYASFLGAADTPVEGLLGGWARMGDNFVMRAGVGTGFTSAIGSPLVRAVLSVGWEPRWREFLEIEPVVQVVEVPVERPIDDTPPGPGTLIVRVTDGEGNPLNGRAEVTHISVPELVELPKDPTHLDIVAGRVEAQTVPGRVALKVSADGYATVYLEGKVVSGDVLSFTVPLAQAKAVLRDDRIEILEQVFFEYDSAAIKQESFALLQQVATLIVEHEQILKLRIEGHTDSRGEDQYNFALSNDRAEAVMEFLVAQGVARSRLSSLGYGERSPLDPRENEEAWAINRRVEFIIDKWGEPEDQEF